METAAATPAPDDGEGGDGTESKAKKSNISLIIKTITQVCP